jgi:hypothetical protein
MGGDQVRRGRANREDDALGEDADAVAARLPDSPEVLMWDGIITSERASMASAFFVLGLAKRARDILARLRLRPTRRVALWLRSSVHDELW